MRFQLNKTDKMFQDDVEKLKPKIKDLSTVMDKSMLSIEIIIDRNKDLDELRNRILKVINWIREKYSFGCIYVGMHLILMIFRSLRCCFHYSL